MRRLVISFFLLLCCISCSNVARRIPKDKLSHIYADMYVSDQWMLKHQPERRKTDTLAVYEPIMKRYGYNFRDYDKTVHWYVEHPDKLLKVVESARDIVEERHQALEKMLKIKEANEELMEGLKGTYVSQTFWPALLDSNNYSINAQRRDSVRTDPEPEVRPFVGDKPIAHKREDLQF